MAEFYIEKKPNETGVHIVHSSVCAALPEKESVQYLGSFSNANAPVKRAVERYSKVATCPSCC